MQSGCSPKNFSFNSRAREGRDGDVTVCPLKHSFQFTRPRGARRWLAASPSSTSGVSIHAPARGATVWACVWPLRFLVSIHAPARGATEPVAQLLN